MKLEDILSLELHPFFDYIKTIRYGYQDTHGVLHFEGDPGFKVRDYLFSSPEEVVKNNCGWCWDVANLIALYCSHRGIEHITLFLEYHTPDFHQTHTQVFLKLHSMWYPAPDNSSGESFGSGGCADYISCRERFVDTFRAYLKYVQREHYDEHLLLLNPVTVPIPAHVTDEEYLELARKC